jgi:hypothetical protein
MIVYDFIDDDFYIINTITKEIFKGCIYQPENNKNIIQSNIFH